MLISLLFVIDETYGFVAVPISVLYVYFFDWKKDTQYIKWTLIGLFPFTAAHFVLNYIQFKTIFPPQLFLDKYFSYEGSKWVGEPTGYEALDHTWWVRIFNYSFGSHGLFLYQPILIIPFFVKKFWKKKLALYVFSLSAFYIIFNAIMQPNYGGSAFGPRRFLPLIPILFYFVFLSWYQAKYMKLMIILLFIVTLAISFLGYLNPWNNYEIYGRNGSEYYFPIKYTYQKHLRTFYNIKI